MWTAPSCACMVVKFGVLKIEGVHLAIEDQDIRGPIRLNKIILQQELKTGSAGGIDRALIEFFDQIYDATCYARVGGQFHFPPRPPRP
jgi:hypothetical protein